MDTYIAQLGNYANRKNRYLRKIIGLLQDYIIWIKGLMRNVWITSTAI